jgi:hypothetical protein
MLAVHTGDAGLAETEAVMAEVGLQLPQLYIHEDGASWDFILVKPHGQDEKKWKLAFELLRKKGHPKGGRDVGIAFVLLIVWRAPPLLAVVLSALSEVVVAHTLLITGRVAHGPLKREFGIAPISSSSGPSQMGAARMRAAFEGRGALPDDD